MLMKIIIIMLIFNCCLVLSKKIKKIKKFHLGDEKYSVDDWLKNDNLPVSELKKDISTSNHSSTSLHNMSNKSSLSLNSLYKPNDKLYIVDSENDDTTRKSILKPFQKPNESKTDSQLSINSRIKTTNNGSFVNDNINNSSDNSLPLRSHYGDKKNDDTIKSIPNESNYSKLSLNSIEKEDNKSLLSINSHKHDINPLSNYSIQSRQSKNSKIKNDTKSNTSQFKDDITSNQSSINDERKFNI